MLSKKDSMVKRKLSFEFPRLRIGSKRETRNSRDQPKTEQDSPPATPQSLRPPLSPRTENQLRLACAYVLQDFKPSHQIYEEKYGRSEDQKPRLSYPNAEKSRGRKDEAAEAPPVRTTSNRKETQERSSSLAKPKTKPTIKSQAFFEGLSIDTSVLDELPPPVPNKAKLDRMVNEEIRADLSHFNPAIASPAFFSGVDVDRLRREQTSTATTMRPIDAALSSDPGQVRMGKALKRSISNPAATPRVVMVEHSRKPVRSESADTTASSAQTEGTDQAWNNSTAPTTTVVTPARGSLNRASQRRGSEKFLTSDIEFMRHKLEDHRRLQDEEKAQLELQNQVLSSLGIDSSSSLPSSANTEVPWRRHVSSSSDSHAETAIRGRVGSLTIQERRKAPPVPHLDSIQTQRMARSESRRRRSTPRSESRTELDMLRPESRQSRRGSQSTLDLLADGKANNDMSRTSSSSRGVFRANSRSNKGTGAPPGSLQSSKPPSRSRSIESIRSAVSSNIDSATSKLRGRKSSKNQDSSSDNNGSRPGTSRSKRRSRELNREEPQPLEPKSKKGKGSINLNRELPPLPSLDQWKPEETPHAAINIIPADSPEISHGPLPSAYILGGFSNADLTPGNRHASTATSRIHSIISRYSKLSENWVPPMEPVISHSAMASPTLPPEFHSPVLDEALDVPGKGVGRPASLPTSPMPLKSPVFLAPEEKKNRVPSEYMFRRNFGMASVPSTPLPVPPPHLQKQKQTLPLPPAPPLQAQQGELYPPLQPRAFLAPAAASTVELRRRTQDMFLPDLDARARSTSVTESHREIPSRAQDGRISTTSNTSSASALKRQNTMPYLRTNDPLPTIPSHSKSNSEHTNFSPGSDSENYNRLYDMGYRNIVQLQPQQSEPTLASSAASIDMIGLPQRKESKRWWKRGTSKREKGKSSGDFTSSPSRLLTGVGEEDGSAPTVVRF